jgi:penicillin-binding protein 1A
LAHRMGITTPISTNPAMTIGGLKVGVTPLDMAHAYETIAHAGRRVSGTLAEAGSPVGIQEVVSPTRALPDGSHHDVNRVVTKPVLPPDIAATETSVLETVLQYGTARSAAIGQFAAGKTGTTSNYGDAWFVGWDSKYTVAVWVGYPNSLVPMTTQFDGGPVLGGTFPALIWHDFMISALHIDKSRAEQAAAQAAARASGGKAHGQSTQSTTTSPAEETATPSGVPSATPQSGEEAAAERHASPNAGGGEHSASPAAPAPSSPSTPAAPSPAESAPAPKGGGGASSEATGGVSASP